VAYEGCEARIVPGQVLCQPLTQLGAGEQATLRIKAKAAQGGTPPLARRASLAWRSVIPLRPRGDSYAPIMSSLKRPRSIDRCCR
jgi:hypothetical protein